MKRLLFKQALILTIGFFGYNVYALEQPKGSSFDARIQYVNYNEKDVVEIDAYPGIATQIRFATDEEILDIASGFSQGWEFVNRRNNLYLKPKSIKRKNGDVLEPIVEKWNTNLVVTTNFHVYSFDLVLHDNSQNWMNLSGTNVDIQTIPKMNEREVIHKSDGRSKKVAYRIVFRYPAEESAKARQAAELRAMEKHLTKTAAPCNWNYSMQVGKGSENITPSMVYDDGRFTYIKFPHNHEFPTVFLVASDKSESLVNSHIDPQAPDVLVVQRVASTMVLRLGTAVVGIFNDSYDANGVPAIEGTTVEGVKRVNKEVKAL